MIKKILYLILVTMVGFIVYYVDFQNVQYKYTLDLVDTAIENKKYVDIGKIFCGLFDSKPLIDYNNDGSELVDLVIYPGTNNTKLEYGDPENPDLYINFEKSYNFYLFNNKYDLATYSDAEIGSNVNKSGIKFISDNSEYYYYFVVNDTINSEYYVKNPNEVIEAIINDGRDFVTTCENVNFISIAFTENIIKEIERILGSSIKKFQLLDAKGKLVLENSITLDFNNQFFIDNSKIIDDYNDCYERLISANGDAKLEKQINEEFDTIYTNWKNDFIAAKHPTYTLGFEKDYLNPSSLKYKTLGTLAIYLLIAIGLYVFFFYRKNVKYLFCKIFKIEIHEEDEDTIQDEHSIKDDLIDVGGGPIEQPTRLRREMFIKKEKGDNNEQSPNDN